MLESYAAMMSTTLSVTDLGMPAASSPFSVLRAARFSHASEPKTRERVGEEKALRRASVTKEDGLTD